MFCFFRSDYNRTYESKNIDKFKDLNLLRILKTIFNRNQIFFSYFNFYIDKNGKLAQCFGIPCRYR